MKADFIRKQKSRNKNVSTHSFLRLIDYYIIIIHKNISSCKWNITLSFLLNSGIFQSQRNKAIALTLVELLFQ